MNLKDVFYHLQALLFFLPGFGQKIHPEIIGNLPEDVGECSGLALVPSGNIVQINDSGNPPCLFFTDTTGNLLEEKCPDFLENEEWEDLAYGDGHLYIGDFGNNRNRRKDLKIYRVGITASDSVYDAGVIRYRYANQENFPARLSNRHFDMEAMVYSGDSLFLFSKNRTFPFTGYTYLYGMPARPGDYSITPLDSFKTGVGARYLYWVGGAALSPGENTLALLGYDKLWLFYDFPDKQFFRGKHKELHFKELTQKEGIEFRDPQTLFVADEKLDFFSGGYMYEVKLPESVVSNQNYVWPVRITPPKIIEDSLNLHFTDPVKDNIHWEIFNTKGERVRFGTIKGIRRKENLQYTIDISEIPAGGYVLNVIIDERPHGFKVKKVLITGDKEED